MMIRHRYWNANGFAVAIVAKEGGVNDWAAYIGATEGVATLEHETVKFVLAHGCKISQKIAEAIFPEFKEAKLAWRE
jgi:hypothetical protein